MKWIDEWSNAKTLLSEHNPVCKQQIACNWKYIKIFIKTIIHNFTIYIARWGHEKDHTIINYGSFLECLYLWFKDITWLKESYLVENIQWTYFLISQHGLMALQIWSSIHRCLVTRIKERSPLSISVLFGYLLNLATQDSVLRTELLCNVTFWRLVPNDFFCLKTLHSIKENISSALKSQ